LNQGSGIGCKLSVVGGTPTTDNRPPDSLTLFEVIMETITRPQATLVDLLDRVLDRGLIIDADIIISLAGVPLVGVKLRAAIAGIETMVKYGVLSVEDL
jgi:hypothetical protein